MSGLVRRTEDAYLGLEDPTDEEWRAWHAAMLEERARALAEAGIAGDYDDPATDWSDTSFRQLFVFMYDASFYDRARGRYRTRELLAEARGAFGRVDSVLLWHAYPRIGFDERGQFDFYQDMPGGLAGLRADVCDHLHAEGVRVLVDYSPPGGECRPGDVPFMIQLDPKLSTLTGGKTYINVHSSTNVANIQSCGNIP